MPASSSFRRGLAASLAAPVLVVAIALESSALSTTTNPQLSLSLCSLASPFALATAAAFFAIAAYVSLVEHPARMSLGDDAAALLQWKPSYKCAAVIQAPLAGVAALLGAICWRKATTKMAGGGDGADPLWLLGTCAAAFKLPDTLLVIMPTNNILLSSSKGSNETRRLLSRWGHLHSLRTVAGGVAAASFLVAVARSKNSSSTTSAGTSVSSSGPVASLKQLLRLSRSDYGV